MVAAAETDKGYQRIKTLTSACVALSRPSEKFLTEPSRKFLLTAVRLKDGTNRDEPRGTGQVGMAERGPGQDAEAARGGPEDGRERAVGAPTAAADETAWRCGGGAWVTGPGVEPQDREVNPEPGHGASAAAGLARLRTDLCQRAVGQTASHPGRQRNAARMDDRSRI